MNERITGIADRAANSGKVVKILCRNSYERRLAHQCAAEKGISHRSIIDYTQIHVNQKVTKTSESGCCTDCDGFEVTISGTPYSFVELNNGLEPTTIGNKQQIPAPLTYNCYGTTLYCIDKHKHEFK
ncbi:Hypothetical protein HVR_LOCUS819 [uncultured virus]|nr:Hypothetical protein HVR_LOCUS819 [uncultured virus]